MSNVVNLDQYRELKRLLETDEEFRNWARAFINEYENPQPVLDFSNVTRLQNYNVTSITLNGIDVTPR